MKISLKRIKKYYSDVERKLESKYGKIINGKRLNGGIVERVLGSEKYLGKVYKEDKEGNRYEFNIFPYLLSNFLSTSL